MSDFLFFLILGVIIVATIVVPFKQQKEHNASYQECKTHTQDLEWCFKQFKPNNL